MDESNNVDLWGVFNKTQTGLALASEDGQWIEVNDHLCAITGYTRAELLGIHTAEFTHPDDLEIEDCFLRSLRTGARECNVQKRFIRKDGQTVLVNITASPLLHPANERTVFVLTIHDITGLANTQDALHAATNTLGEALSVTATGIWEWDLTRDSVYWSVETERLWGLRKGEFSGHTDDVVSRIHTDDVARWSESIKHSLKTGSALDIEIRVLHPDQSFRWIYVRGQVDSDAYGHASAIRGTVSDATERVETQQRLETIQNHLQLAQQIAGAGSWVLNVPEDELYWSEEIYRIFGLDPDTFKANLAAFLECVHPEDRDYVLRSYKASVVGIKDYDIEHRIIRQNDKALRWVHERCFHTRDDNGQVIRSDGVVHDITERKEVESEIRRLAMTDHLTGLSNRHHFFESFNDLLSLAKREGLVLSLMLMDLDGFKGVNDTYGHPAGDELLVGVSSRLREVLRETDIIARLGGDEFAALLINPKGDEGTARTGVRIRQAFEEPFQLGEAEGVRVGISIGVASYPDDGENEKTLLKEADEALYKDKRFSRDQQARFWG